MGENSKILRKEHLSPSKCISTLICLSETLLDFNQWKFLKAFPTISNNFIIPVRIIPSFFRRSTTNLAFSSICAAVRFKDKHKLIPSLNTHSSAATMAVFLIALAYLVTHSPSAFLIIPPPPTRPGLRNEEPSEFNLNQPVAGWFRLTWEFCFWIPRLNSKTNLQ